MARFGSHGLDLCRVKKRLCCRIAILASSNSHSSGIPPSFAFSRSLSNAFPSLRRVAKRPRSRPGTHHVRVAAATSSPRDTVSRSSPRGRCRMTAILQSHDTLAAIGSLLHRTLPVTPRPPSTPSCPNRSVMHLDGRNRPLTKCLDQPWCAGHRAA